MNTRLKLSNESFPYMYKGYGKQSIAKILNAEGILCPAEYKKVNGEKYKNCNRLESTAYWSYSTINILEREMYVGNMVQGNKASAYEKQTENAERRLDNR